MLRRVALILGDFFHRIGEDSAQPPSPNSPIAQDERHTTAAAGTSPPGVALSPVSETPNVPLTVPEETPHQVNTTPNAQAEPTPTAPDPPPPNTTATTTSTAQSPSSPGAGPIPRAFAPPLNPMPSSRASARPTSAYFNPPLSSPPNVHLALASAKEMLNSANAPGLGSTMQRIRVDRAMFLLRNIESQALSEVDMVLVRGQLFTVQVSVCATNVQRENLTDRLCTVQKARAVLLRPDIA
jgi:hypothetical protein